MARLSMTLLLFFYLTKFTREIREISFFLTKPRYFRKSCYYFNKMLWILFLRNIGCRTFKTLKLYFAKLENRFFQKSQNLSKEKCCYHSIHTNINCIIQVAGDGNVLNVLTLQRHDRKHKNARKSFFCRGGGVFHVSMYQRIFL